MNVLKKEMFFCDQNKKGDTYPRDFIHINS